MAPPPKWPKPPGGPLPNPALPAPPSPMAAVESPDRSPTRFESAAPRSTPLEPGPAGSRPDLYSPPPRLEPIMAPARLDVGTNSSPPRPKPNASAPTPPIASVVLTGAGADTERPMPAGASVGVRPGGGGVDDAGRTTAPPMALERLGLGVAALLSWSKSRRLLLLVNTGATLRECKRVQGPGLKVWCVGAFLRAAASHEGAGQRGRAPRRFTHRIQAHLSWRRR